MMKEDGIDAGEDVKGTSVEVLGQKRFMLLLELAWRWWQHC